MKSTSSGFFPIDEPIGSRDSGLSDHQGNFVGLRVVWRAFGRRRGLWMALAVAGLVVGAAAVVALPAKYTATSTLDLLHNPNDDPSQDMLTDTALLTTTTVAQRVIDQLGLQTTAQVFLGQYQGVALSNNVLQISMTGPTPSAAVQRLNTLDSAYLSVRSSVYEAQSRNLVTALNAQYAGLQTKVQALDAKINAGGLSRNELATLQLENGQDITQQQAIEATIASDTLALQEIVKGSTVLASATSVHHSTKKRLLLDGASGLIAGLAIGLGYIAVQTAVSDKLRLRSEFALALDAPVGLSIARYECPRLLRMQRLRRRLRKIPAMPRTVRHLGSALGTGTHQALVVVSIDSIEVSALAVAELATTLVSETTRVSVVDFTPDAFLGQLLGVRRDAADDVVIAGSQWPIHVVVPGDDDVDVAHALAAEPAAPGPTHTWPSTNVTLALAVLDPGIGARQIADVASVAVAVVTAGSSSATKVRSNAEMLLAADISVVSIVLVGVDANDDSIGEADTQARDLSDELVEITAAPRRMRGDS